MVDVHGQVDRYLVESLVARGRSGEVFRARAGDGAPIALKVYDRAEDGRREADRLGRCAHPAIIRPIDRGRTPDGRSWLALPWIEGRTLAGLLTEERPLAGDRVVDLVAQLAAAVDALHETGLTHGDLSPNNVLVDDADRLTLIDLGAAGPAADGAVERTVGVEVATTPRYAAPEVARGEAPGPAADRYALGLIAYEALTGAFPFPEVATPIAMLSHHASSEPVAPSEHRPDLSAEVDTVLIDALAKEPDDRPASALLLASRLRGAVENGGAPAASARRRSAGARRPGLTVLVVTAALALGAAVVMVSRQPGGEPAAPGTSSVVALEPVAPQPGTARGLSCNLLQNPDFEGAADNDFYGGDPTNTVEPAAASGVGGSGALRVGADDRFGLYAEIVPIGSHERFVFSAWVRHEGDPAPTALYVDYLDADFVQLTAERDLLGPGTLVDDPPSAEAAGTYVRVEATSDAAPGAVYAVPTLFKGGSPGSLLVDEVVFGPTETCPDLAS